MLDTVNMERSRAERLRIDRVSKSFFGVPVLREVSLTAGTGEIIGLLGANGAGKSTLMKILSGVYSSEGGEISVDGHRVKIETPQDAIAAGIRLMPQELSVHPDLTVAENICIADLPRRRFLGMPWIDRGDMERTAADYLDRLGLGHIDPHTRMGSLSLPQQRIVEIARALVGDARVLIMDEPTATLAEAEVRTLFEVIERLRLQGVTIIYISHYLDEVFRLCDRIVVLRDGDVRGNFSTAETDQDTVLTAMLGSELGQLYPEKAGDLSHNEPILSVEGMSLPGAFQDVSFQVRRGEVFGVFGLVGSGAEQIGRALYGGRSQVQVRQAKFKGAPFSPTSPRDSVRDGLAFVAAERKSEGLVGILSVRENTTLPFLKNSRGTVWSTGSGKVPQPSTGSRRSAFERPDRNRKSGSFPAAISRRSALRAGWKDHPISLSSRNRPAASTWARAARFTTKSGHWRNRGSASCWCRRMPKKSPAWPTARWSWPTAGN